MSWLNLGLVVLVAVPALIVSQISIILILFLFAAAFSLAKRRFTPAILTVLATTAAIMLSPLGTSMFDSDSYRPYQTYKIDSESGAALKQMMRRGEEPSPELLRQLRDDIQENRTPIGTDVNTGIFFIVAIVGLGYLAVVLGAAIGVRNSRRLSLDATSN